MPAPDPFWSTNYYAHPPLTEDAVAEAHRILGLTLPPDLIKILTVQNGGYTQGFAHRMRQRTTWAEDHVPLDDLSGILPRDTDSPMNLVRTPEMTAEWGLPPRQVLLSGDGHYWITLDYRSGLEPSVAWIDVECGEDMQIAPTFGAFLNGLVPASMFDPE